MTMQERIGRLTELLLVLFDPRTDENTKADLIEAADAPLLREIATIACVWVAQSLDTDAFAENRPIAEIMDQVRVSLAAGAAEFDRLDHEGGSP